MKLNLFSTCAGWRNSIVLIPVIYLNGKQDMVKEFFLAELIERQKIEKFKRREGWVRLPFDQIRQGNSESYSGPERRGQILSGEAS